MAVSSRPHRAQLDDPGSGPILLSVAYGLTTDNAEAVALGASMREVVVQMEVPRADAARAIGALLADAVVVNDGGWPEALIPLPRPRKA